MALGSTPAETRLVGAVIGIWVAVAAGICTWILQPENKPFQLPVPHSPRALSTVTDVQSQPLSLRPPPRSKQLDQELLGRSRYLRTLQAEELRQIQLKQDEQSIAEIRAQLSRQPRTTGKEMYWGGRSADDPASNPKVIAHLMIRGIPLYSVNRYFEFQWQVDALDDAPPAHALKP